MTRPGGQLDRRLGDPGRVRAVGGGDLTSALQRAGHDAGVNDTNLRVALAGYGLAGAVFHAPARRRDPRDGRHHGGHPRPRPRRPGPRTSPRRGGGGLGGRGAGHAPPTCSSSPPRTARTSPLARAGSAAGVAVVVDKPLAVDRGRGAARWSTQAERRRRAAHRLPEPALGRRLPHLRRLRRRGRSSATSLRFESRFERWRPAAQAGLARDRRPRGGRRRCCSTSARHLVDQALQLFGPPVRVLRRGRTRRARAPRSTTTPSSRSSTRAACARTCG